MAILQAIAIGGSVIQAYGNWKASRSQAKSLREQAELDAIRVSEISLRNNINNSLVERDAALTAGLQKAQLAASGGGFGASSLALLEQTAVFAAEEIDKNNRETEFEVFMLNQGIQSKFSAAGEIEKAGILSAIGGLGLGVARTSLSSPGGLQPASQLGTGFQTTTPAQGRAPSVLGS